MAKFEEVFRVGAFALTLLLILTGCGSDKYTTPVSDIVYLGTNPKNLKLDVDPSATTLQYFKFKLAMSDPNQSSLSGDHWTIEGCRGYFTVDDPTAQFVEPFPEIDVRMPFAVATTIANSYTVTLVTKEWIERNCQWIKDTETIVPVTAHLQFFAHRNSDKMRVVIPVDFSFTVGDF